METWLLAITFASVLVAVVTSTATWKWVRENRDRTAARVSTLKTLAFADDGADEAGPQRMFGASVERGAPKRRWIAVSVVAAVMTSIAGIVFAVHEAKPTAPSGPSQAVARPLDLLMLQQTTNRLGEFVVTGQVRNARNGESLQGVAAFVDLFDQNGRRVAGDKAPLAVPVLQAGDESSFVVALPKTAGVARYRVGFRLEDGSSIPHVDRRALSAGLSRAKSRGQAVERTGI